MASSPTAAASDLQLLEQWRAGDDGAGEALFERHFEALYRFFCNKVGREVDDLVQETFLGCVKAKERFRGDSSFRTFLFAVARNQLFKLRDRHTKNAKQDDFQETRVADLDASPTQLAVEHEEQALLLRALRRLPIDLQIALELFYWEGMQSKDIAVVLEIPHGTVRSRLRRGRTMLREIVEQLAESPKLQESTLADFEGWLRSIQGKVPRAAES
ncbi:MAG: sigma-70 family RNA polymerase sigma factor [Myxococcota bacterium]